MDLQPRFSKDEIASAVSRVAAEISANHPTETPLMVGILTGSFVFLAHLVRELTIWVRDPVHSAGSHPRIRGCQPWVRDPAHSAGSHRRIRGLQPWVCAGPRVPGKRVLPGTSEGEPR